MRTLRPAEFLQNEVIDDVMKFLMQFFLKTFSRPPITRQSRDQLKVS